MARLLEAGAKAMAEDVDVVLVGLEDAIREQLRSLSAENLPRLTVRHASEIVAMDESPAVALRSYSVGASPVSGSRRPP